MYLSGPAKFIINSEVVVSYFYAELQAQHLSKSLLQTAQAVLLDTTPQKRRPSRGPTCSSFETVPDFSVPSGLLWCKIATKITSVLAKKHWQWVINFTNRNFINYRYP